LRASGTVRSGTGVFEKCDENGGGTRGMGEEAVEVVRLALFEALLIAAPILGAGLVVGLFISLFQAVTQIQEQTLTFVPKIAAMIVVAIFLLGWISARMTEFATDMFTGMTGG